MSVRIASALATGAVVLLSAAVAGETPSIRLSPQDAGHWRAEYRLTHAATSLTMVHDLAGARARTWSAADSDFEIVPDGDTEAVRRKDGAPFKAVSLIAPTAYVRPENSYLTFAKFSDGGLLLYTGNFRACAGECPVDADGNEGPWRMTIAPGGKSRIIAGGAVKRGKAVLSDHGDGTKIYIGEAKIVEGPALLAVIDPNLPTPIKDKLDALFPKLMDYYGGKLGALTEKQMMFVSWDVPGTETGAHSKGGTLPSQVFIHFEGAKMPQYTSADDYPFTLSWFFAHEAAHLHQAYGSADPAEADTWIHEGGAEALAYVALKDFGAAPDDFLAQRLRKAAAGCAGALQDGPLSTVGERGQFQAFYDCGLLAHLAAAKSSMAASGTDIFALWKTFLDRVEAGAPWTAETFSSLVAELGDDAAADFISTLATQPISDPEKFLHDQLAVVLPEALDSAPAP